MANRDFNRRQSLEKEVKDVYAKVTIGAAGAPTLTSSIGIDSIVRNSAGDYTITLQDSYMSLKFFEVIQLSTTPQDLSFQIKVASVNSLPKGSVEFLCLTGATPTDPANGMKLFIKFELKNTSVV